MVWEESDWDGLWRWAVVQFFISTKSTYWHRLFYPLSSISGSWKKKWTSCCSSSSRSMPQFMSAVELLMKLLSCCWLLRWWLTEEQRRRKSRGLVFIVLVVSVDLVFFFQLRLFRWYVTCCQYHFWIPAPDVRQQLSFPVLYTNFSQLLYTVVTA